MDDTLSKVLWMILDWPREGGVVYRQKKKSFLAIHNTPSRSQGSNGVLADLRGCGGLHVFHVPVRVMCVLLAQPALWKDSGM